MDSRGRGSEISSELSDFDGLSTLLVQRLTAMRNQYFDERGAHLAIGRSGSLDPRICRALDYLVSHMDGPVRLADVAQAAAVERKYFSTLFRRETGKRCFDLLSELRVRSAQKMLERSRVGIGKVAASVGLSIRAFERAFRRHTGMTPGAYRRQVGRRRATEYTAGS
jgi:two-component system response regulator YesN